MSSQELVDFIRSEQFCSGNVSGSAYATAWAARIRSKEHHGQPAFPSSLDWIRNNQKDDGSWGNKWPVSYQDAIISTLIAIIVLKQWNYYEDIEKIEKAINFVERNSIKLISIQEQDIHVGFELIFMTLIEEVKHFGLWIDEKVYNHYKYKKNIKMDFIRKAKTLSHNNKYPSWLFDFEAISDIYDKNTIENIFRDSKTICTSISATCSALYNNYNLPKCYKYIERKVSAGNGFIADLDNLKVFDIVWSYTYLIWVGFDFDLILESERIGYRHLEYLESLIARDNTIGFGDGAPIDPDTIASTIYVLNHFGKKVPLDGLLKFYSKNYFITYFGETSFSLSTNINILICLKQFKDDNTICEIIRTHSEWLKTYIIDSDYDFKDKWMISKYYSMTRAVFAFQDIDDHFVDTCIDILREEQKCDGGWGGFEQSTNIETALVVICLIHYMTKRKLKSQCIYYYLRRAQNYLDNDREIVPLWIGKGLYSMTSLDKLTVLSAKFYLEKT